MADRSIRRPARPLSGLMALLLAGNAAAGPIVQVAVPQGAGVPVVVPNTGALFSGLPAAGAPQAFPGAAPGSLVSNLSAPVAAPLAAGLRASIETALPSFELPAAAVRVLPASASGGRDPGDERVRPHAIEPTGAFPGAPAAAQDPENLRSLVSDAISRVSHEEAFEKVGRLFGSAVRAAALPVNVQVQGTALFAPLVQSRGTQVWRESAPRTAAPAPLYARTARPTKGPIALRAVEASREAGRGHKREPGVFSNNRLKTFETDPERYALTYLFGKEEEGAKAFPYAVGLAVHETMELVFKEIEEGADPKSLQLADALAAYDVIWDRLLGEARFEAREGMRPSDYKRRGQRFIERRWETVANFTGKVESLETEMKYAVRDPGTGKDYHFKGIPDRVTVDGKTLYINDWKTHFNPPTVHQLKRDDYQLGLYVLGMMELFPEKLEGKRIVAAWDYKEFTQEIEVTPEYLSVVKDRILRVLHGIETFERIVEGEKADWNKRAAPVARPKGLPKAKADVNRIGLLEQKLRIKQGELRELNARLREREAGLKAFAAKEKLTEIAGKTHKLTLESATVKKVPTATGADPAAHEAVVEALRKEGVWEKYSKLDYARVQAAAMVNGYPDQPAMDKVMPHLTFAHENQVKVEPAAAAKGGLEGVRAYNLHKPDYDGIDAEPGMYSASKVSLFERSPKAYALHYLFGVKSEEALSYELLVGLAAHETMEDVFTAMKGGRPSKDIKLADVIKLYREIWNEREAEGNYGPTRGSRLKRADYIRKGEEYIRAKWVQLTPFEKLGEIIFLESRMHFTLTDPETGKVYKFQGIPDRVMVVGNKVQIRDWKTHFIPRTEEEIRAEDFQLGLYVMAMRQLYPGLMAGRQIELVWDFKNAGDVITIQADEAYLKEVEIRVIGLLRSIEKFTAEVEEDAAKWEKIAGTLRTPKGITEARRWVDEMGRLEASAKAKRAEIKAMQETREQLSDAVAEFQRATGWWTIETPKFSAYLQKKPVVTVPTKTGGADKAEKEANARANAEIVRILKASGVWHKYSSLDYRVLNAALADKEHPDREVLKKIQPYLQKVTETTTDLKPVAKPNPPTDNKSARK